jgi:hypothetical protein
MGERMPKKTNKPAADFGTPQLARHFTIVPKLSDPTTLTGKIMDGGEIDRLLLHDVISANQHGTLTMLAKRLYSYGFSGMRSPDYASPPTHLDPELVSAKKAEVIRGAVSLIKKMDNHPYIQQHRRMKLINLVLYDAAWGRLRHQIEDLHACCQALDDIFIR